MEAVAASPRYRGVHVCGYRAVSDVVATEQFAAMAFRFPVGFSYLSFRGTDSTIVGWKEDFNMAFRCPVPAQESAARYVDEAADAIDGPPRPPVPPSRLRPLLRTMRMTTTGANTCNRYVLTDRSIRQERLLPPAFY